LYDAQAYNILTTAFGGNSHVMTSERQRVPRVDTQDLPWILNLIVMRLISAGVGTTRFNSSFVQLIIRVQKSRTSLQILASTTSAAVVVTLLGTDSTVMLTTLPSSATIA
jgi:hypothetical protein